MLDRISLLRILKQFKKEILELQTGIIIIPEEDDIFDQEFAIEVLKETYDNYQKYLEKLIA